MARVTVQDCIKKVPNRFDLVVAAAQRSREISNGMPIEIERDNDKNPVVSLREIAEDAIDPSTLQERFIRSMQKNILRMSQCNVLSTDQKLHHQKKRVKRYFVRLSKRIQRREI